MRLDEIEFESIIQRCNGYLKNVLINSFKQAKLECDAWEEERRSNPEALHPLENRINRRIPALHDNK